VKAQRERVSLDRTGEPKTALAHSAHVRETLHTSSPLLDCPHFLLAQNAKRGRSEFVDEHQMDPSALEERFELLVRERTVA